jgi:hypothetical protein
VFEQDAPLGRETSTNHLGEGLYPIRDGPRLKSAARRRITADARMVELNVRDRTAALTAVIRRGSIRLDQA